MSPTARKLLLFFLVIVLARSGARLLEDTAQQRDGPRRASPPSELVSDAASLISAGSWNCASISIDSGEAIGGESVDTYRADGTYMSSWSLWTGWVVGAGVERGPIFISGESSGEWELQRQSLITTIHRSSLRNYNPELLDADAAYGLLEEMDAEPSTETVVRISPLAMTLRDSDGEAYECRRRTDEL